MPILKSAKKRVRQAKKRRDRNYPVRTKMKTYIKKVLGAVEEGNKTEAEKLLKQAHKIIDTAAKKNIIHKNNAARKKSMLAKRVNKIDEEKAKVKPAAKTGKTGAKKKPAKKEKPVEAKTSKSKSDESKPKSEEKSK